MSDTHTLAVASTKTNKTKTPVHDGSRYSVSSEHRGGEHQKQTSTSPTDHTTGLGITPAAAVDCDPCHQQQASTDQQPRPPSAAEAPAALSRNGDTSTARTTSKSSVHAPITIGMYVLRSRQHAWLRAPRFSHAAWDTRGSPLEWSWPYFEPPFQRCQRHQLRT